MPYHINPKTGNANVCRANLGKCPYEKDFAEHYDTKEEARKAYEQEMSHPISIGSRRLIQRYRTQNEIMRGASLGRSFFKDPEMTYLVNKRDRLDNSWVKNKGSFSADDAGESSVNTINFPERDYQQENGDYQGFSNDLEYLRNNDVELWDALEESSIEWLNRCNSQEAEAIHIYSCSSNDYAQTFHEENESVSVFHNALKKSPKFEKPITVFSGLSYQTRDIIMAQNPTVGSTFSLSRVLSTSVNPAQVNGFATHDYAASKLNDTDNITVALVVETDNGGVMAAASRSPHEFEVLLPPAEYEVVEIQEKKNFAWSEDNPGIGIDKVIKVRKL